MVAEGSFRQDLFYRLNVIPVQVPPLRERRDDIPLLTQHFLERLCAEMGRPPVTVAQEAMRRLMAYSWPGNIRQLENTMERALAFGRGRAQIEVADLTPEIDTSPPPDAAVDIVLPEEGLDFDRCIGDLELALIRRSLERTQGNKRQAARLLGLKRTTLIEKLKRLEPQAVNAGTRR
jgi:DNA-binding NtrC family response regulator